MNEMTEHLRQQIQQKGPISFAQFMDDALYLPRLGYYQKPCSIGREGDFYTSVSVGSIFGNLLAQQFMQWWQSDPEHGEGVLQLVEAGAHDGQLAKDILLALGSNVPAAFSRVQYRIVEPLPERERRQRETLLPFADAVSWCKSLSCLGTAFPADNHAFQVIFSNELLDALPVHRIAWDAKSKCWFEMGVGWSGSAFDWAPLKDPSLFTPKCGTTTLLEKVLREVFPEIDFAMLRDTLPDTYTVELPLAATRWWREAASQLHRGKLVAFDYGFGAKEGMAPERMAGSIRAFRRHGQVRDVLGDPGAVDITADVNFGALQAVGEENGLITDMFMSQEEFFCGLIQRLWAARAFALSPQQTRQIRTLTHPEHLGRSFRVLVQSCCAVRKTRS